MSYTLPTPSVEVSPQGGGTIDPPVVINSGTFNGTSASAYRNYRYVAKPSPGYRFLGFDIYVQEETIDVYDGHQSTPVVVRDGVYPSRFRGRESSNGSYVYETSIDANYLDAPVGQTEEGSAWWWTWHTGSDAVIDYSYSDVVTSVRVVAVFEPRNTGRLVYSPSQNGQLVYSGSQGGSLVYDGDFSGGTN